MKEEVLSSLKKLKDYCEKEQFKGWDPYDGLNSRIFQALPFFKNSAICRLAVIQFFKCCLCQNILRNRHDFYCCI